MFQGHSFYSSLSEKHWLCFFKCFFQRISSSVTPFSISLNFLIIFIDGSTKTEYNILAQNVICDVKPVVAVFFSALNPVSSVVCCFWQLLLVQTEQIFTEEYKTVANSFGCDCNLISTQQGAWTGEVIPCGIYHCVLSVLSFESFRNISLIKIPSPSC